MKKIIIILYLTTVLGMISQGQVTQFPQVYFNGQGSGGANLYIHQSASYSSPNITLLSTTSNIGAVSLVTNSGDQYFMNWIQVCLPSTTGNIAYGYVACDEFYARINEVNNYGTVTTATLNIRTGAGTTFPNVTIGGVNATFGNNSIVALTGNTSNVGGVIWYQVHLTMNCSQLIGWVSSGSGGTLLSINSNTTNYRNAGGRICTDANSCNYLGSINGAIISITGIGTIYSSGGFYQYKLPLNYSCTITCTYPGYNTSTPPLYTYTAINHIYGLNFVLSNTSCNYLILPNSNTNVPSSGVTNLSVTVTTQPGCPWSSNNNGYTWITATSSGTGSGTALYSVSQNPGSSSRTGTITIAGQNFTITQAGGSCTYTISPTSNNSVSVSGVSNSSVTVTTQPGCPWSSNNNGYTWITATSSGTGSGTALYSVAQNPGSSSRTGTITIAGQNFTITQVGGSCTYTISPTSNNSVPVGGVSNSNVTVTTQPGCAWSSNNNGYTWITATSSGTGSGTAIYSVSQNPGSSSRTGTITIAGQNFTITQAGGSCTYSISPTSNNSVPVGGVSNSSVTVTTQSGCTWSSNNNGYTWITSISSGTGSGTALYSVSQNPGNSPRTGIITIAGQNFTITQAGASSSGIIISSSVIPPWQRERDSFNGSITVDLSNAGSNPHWHIEADAFNETGAYVGNMNIGTGTATNTISFTSNDVNIYIHQGWHFTWNAVLENNNSVATVLQQTSIIEGKWDNKNAVFYNSSSNQLLIPLHYFANTISTAISFSRIAGTSSYSGSITNTSTVQFGNQKYFAIDYSNSLIQSVKAGSFNYTISYNPSAFYIESGTFDLTKVGNINNTNNGNNNIVVLVGGNIDIESSIQSLPNQNTSLSLFSWSIANNISNEYGKNTWYIATGNLNSLQKNAYNLGIALEEIRKECINAGAISPNISVIAHSKGGLEMRMMMDAKGAPNSSPYNFTISPLNPFSNVSINNCLHSVIFIGTPHNGVITGFQENSIAPFSFINSEINVPQIRSYFSNGTSVPNNIRIANVAAYRKCNLSDEAVDLASSDNLVIFGASSIKKFYVKSVPFEADDPGITEVLPMICDGGCPVVFTLFGNPELIPTCYEIICPAVLLLSTEGPVLYNEIINPWLWNNKFHHFYLTSSYVLNQPQLTCLANNSNTPSSILDKIIAVIDNNYVNDCTSPLTQTCQPAWIQLISSVLQNAMVSKKHLDSTYTFIGKSDENGMLQIPFDGALLIGDSLRIEAPGVETIFISVDSLFLSKGELKIPFIKSSISTSKIKHPSFTLENTTPITNNSTIQIKVTAENATSFEIFTSRDTAFVPLILNNNIKTLQLDTGRNLITIKFSGPVDTVFISKEVWFLPDSLMSQFSYNAAFMSNNNTCGTKVYAENLTSPFIKEIDSNSDTIHLLKEKNILRFIRFGYRDTSIIVDSAISINLPAVLNPVSYSSINDSSIINFRSGYKTNYWKTISFLDSTRQSTISIKQYDDNFPGMGLIPKSRMFEMRHLNSNWSGIRFASVLDQIENLSTDSIYLMRIYDDTSFTKILFDSSGTVAGYDSAVQKLTYNYVNFNNGTAAKEALVIMKKQPPIIRNVSSMSVNENDSLSVPLSQFFSDPDSVHNDMTFQIQNPNPAGLHLSISNGNVVIHTNLCYSGNTSFNIQATHDGLRANGAININVIPSVPATVNIMSTTSANICAGKTVTFSSTVANAGISPTYNWYVNDIATGLNSASFTTIPLNSDSKVYCIITPGTACPVIAKSNVINISVIPNVTPTITISQTSCEGRTVIFNSTITNGGATPSYIWTVNGSATGNYTEPIFTLKNSKNGDNVQCTLTTAATCVTEYRVVSSPLSIDCALNPVNNVDGLEGFSIIPNPNTGDFVVKFKLTTDKNISFTLLNNVGQVVYTLSAGNLSGIQSIRIAKAPLQSGVYMLKMILDNESFISKVEVLH